MGSEPVEAGQLPPPGGPGLASGSIEDGIRLTGESLVRALSVMERYVMSYRGRGDKLLFWSLARDLQRDGLSIDWQTLAGLPFTLDVEAEGSPSAGRD